MIRLRRKQELVAGAVITALLLIFASEASIIVATHGLDRLDWDFGQGSITAGGLLGIIGCTDIPAKIKSSKFLTSQTTIFAFMLCLIGFGPQFLRYLPQTESYERLSAFLMLGAILLFAVSSIAGLIYQYVTTRNTADP